MEAEVPFSVVAVIGLGTVGSILAEVLARAGLQVVGIEADSSALSRGRGRVRDRAHRVSNGCGAAEVLERITFTTRPDAMARADLVIEAVPERLGLKCEVLHRAHKTCAPDAVFATTTTALPVSEIALASGRMGRTVGFHLVDLALENVVIELACTPFTEQTVSCDAQDFIRGLSWTPVLVGDRAGFISGALAMGYLNSAAAMYEQHYASRDDIDAAMTLGCGLRRGPLAELDSIGLDVALDTLQALYERSGDRQYLPVPLLGQMVSAGLLGRKTGRGFYTYQPAAGAGPAPSARGESAADPASAARPVGRIGVIGTGTMATGIAEVCAQAGYPTMIKARSEASAKGARVGIESSLQRAAQRGKLTAEQVDRALTRLDSSSDWAALGDCDLVIEAVAEDLAVKRQLFAEMDRACRPGAVLSTTTSSLPVIECAMRTSRPQDVIGLHFFNPAPRMRLVEVAQTVLTAPSVIATARAACESLGKRPVDCADRSGFIVNALLFPYLNRAVTMLQENHATDGEMEMVMKQGWGYPMGPLQLLDVIGLDVALAIQRQLHETFRDPALAPARYLESLVQSGHLGRKTGQGFRSYSGAVA